MSFDHIGYAEAEPVWRDGDLSGDYFTRENHRRIVNWISARAANDLGVIGTKVRRALKGAGDKTGFEIVANAFGLSDPGAAWAFFVTNLERRPITDLEARQVGGGKAASKTPQAGERANAIADALISFDQIELDTKDNELVSGWIDCGALSVVYGESNVGKTIFALDLAAHLAAGVDWHGFKVLALGTGACVVYVAAEGGHGIKRRLLALRNDRPELATDALKVLPAGLDFFGPTDATALIEAMTRLGVRPCLVVLDTLARTMGAGDENSTKDMGAYVGNADRVRAALGCHVMVVHHSGKDTTKGARGSSSLRAATDTEIELTSDFGTVTAAQRKQRDKAHGSPFAYTIRAVHLGEDEHGKAITAPVLDPAEVRRETAKITGTNAHALAALDTLLHRQGEAMTGNLCPADRSGVQIEAWREECRLRKLTEGNSDAQRAAFNRARAALLRARIIGVAGDWVWRATHE